VEEAKVHELLGMQVIVLPEGYRFDVETVYLLRDGVTLLIIPVNEEGEDFVHQRRRAILTDRVARSQESMEPRTTPIEPPTDAGQTSEE
jgi:virulence-associated protein VagC